MRTVSLYEGRIPVDKQAGNIFLILNCRDGRRLDVEAGSRQLEGPGDRLHVTVLRVLASSAAAALPVGERRDALTGLPDGDGFSVRIAEDFARASTRAEPLALILLDIDHLREVNDRLGREAGDVVLKKIAGILRVTIDDERRIARLGNDDFSILLPGAGRGEARRIASSIRSTVERFRFFADDDSNERTRITVTLGATSFPADANNQRELIERAHEALDEARAMGRNRVWCYLRRPRVPIQVPVYFDSADPLLVGYTRDLSPSGIFVQTTAGIEVGMRCALAFPLPGHDGKVHVVGRVVRTVHPQTGDDSQELRIPGLGVEFERFGGETDRRAIESYLHAHESTTLRPEDGLLSL
jgi:diguanylate cyclase (GGDEF)-like protein